MKIETPESYEKMLDTIDEICDSFEDAWRAGSRPVIDEFLARFDGATRFHLWMELKAIDEEYQRKLKKKKSAE